jgi:hypothetical protein
MQPRSYRRSFMKTTTLGFCAFIVLCILLGVTLDLRRWNTGDYMPLWAVWLAVIPFALGLVMLSALAAIVAIGGVVVLYRDYCEARGLPYVPVRPRERIAGPMMSALRAFLHPRARLWPGEWAEVRSLPEILATLDERGRLDGLPFMPEMVAYCGHRFPVQRRVDKVYEYANGSGLRRMRDAVLLEALRCNGQSHAACQAGCQFIWKEAWLKRPGAASTQLVGKPHQIDLQALAHTIVEGELRYVCQMTEIIRASTPLPWWDARHYWRDLTSGNVRLVPFLIGTSVKLFNFLQWKLGGPVWSVIRPAQGSTPSPQPQNLHQGQMVRVRPKHAIETTLNDKLRTRGLQFDRTMLAYSGGSYRVAARIDRILHEATGEVLNFKTPSILLENVYFVGENMFVPQNDYVFWREAWLEPESEPVPTPSSSARDV